MGGSASSQAATDGGELKNTDQTNLGLINLTSESDASLNLTEIVTCACVAILVLYLLSWYCQKRKQRKLEQIRHALRSVWIEPDIARCPVFENPQRAPTNSVPAQPLPPVYPGLDKTAAEQIGAAVMSRYAWCLDENNNRTYEFGTLIG